MRIKVSDYISEYFADKGIEQVFTVVGGGAMHMNDSFGHDGRMKCLYCHHEQACAIAAEGYARVSGKPAIVCVTSGPGAVNSLNGVVGAYQDSIPMLVLCGQVKTSLLEKNSGLPLRTLGGQEFDIVSAVGKMTKYAETVMDAQRIRYHLEKAYYIAINGRKGPCLLDIPLDIQGSFIETESLESFCADEMRGGSDELSEYIPSDKEAVNLLADEVLRKFISSERPVLYAGNGIRLSGGMEEFRKLVALLEMPVVTCWDSIDLIETDDSHYCGRGGTMGDRAGNFAVQNSDFLLCIGNRLSIYQVGYDIDTWARGAYVVDVDIDAAELKKPTIKVDYPIQMDAKMFMAALLKAASAYKAVALNSAKRKEWNDRCGRWKQEYPVVQEKHKKAEGVVNVYSFIDILSRALPDGSCTVVANGSASVVGSQTYYIGKDSRFIMNCAISSMGYGLPAAIGAAVAGKNEVICIEGDGSIMMNLQELQTMVTNKLPIKLFIINNNGYHQIRLTQNNIFHNGLVGVGPESGDLGFPCFKKLADAFGIAYVSISDNSEMKDTIESVLSRDMPVLCEVFVDTKQPFEPKSATKRLENGTLVSPPLEDMAPFLPEEELEKNMIIPLRRKEA